MKKAILLLMLLVIGYTGVMPAWADVSIKIVVVNPSDSQERDIPVKYNLPSGLKREDIKDAGELRVDYDMREGVYCVSGTFKLAPKENKVLKVLVNDIWKIPQEQIDRIQKMLKDSIKASADSDKKELINAVGERIEGKLEMIVNEQKELDTDIEKRMQKYYASIQELQGVKADIFSIERLAGLSGDKKEEDAAKINIQVTNPEDTEITVPVKYYLPREVDPANILDYSGFDLKYDIDKGRPYLEKQEKFAPKEVKNWAIMVKNVWKISDQEVKAHVEEATKTKENFAHSKYKELVQALYDEIQSKADDIITSQSQARTMDEMIAVYRENTKKYDVLKEDLLRMQSLASKDSMKKHNVLRDIKLLEEIKQLSDVLLKRIFKEGKISLIKIILGIIIFVIVITALATMAWFGKIKSDDKREYKSVEEAEAETPQGKTEEKH